MYHSPLCGRQRAEQLQISRLTEAASLLVWYLRPIAGKKGGGEETWPRTTDRVPPVH